MNRMQKAWQPKKAERSEEAVLDQAIQQLLRATKEAAAGQGKPLDPEKLRKEGYSERFIAKVAKA
jgi:hypothetical protein